MMDETPVRRVAEAIRIHRRKHYPMTARPDNVTDLAAACIFTGILEALLWVLEEAPGPLDKAGLADGRDTADFLDEMNQKQIEEAN